LTLLLVLGLLAGCRHRGTVDLSGLKVWEGAFEVPSAQENLKTLEPGARQQCRETSFEQWVRANSPDPYIGVLSRMGIPITEAPPDFHIREVRVKGKVTGYEALGPGGMVSTNRTLSRDDAMLYAQVFSQKECCDWALEIYTSFYEKRIKEWSYLVKGEIYYRNREFIRKVLSVPPDLVKLPQSEYEVTHLIDMLGVRRLYWEHRGWWKLPSCKRLERFIQRFGYVPIPPSEPTPQIRAFGEKYLHELYKEYSKTLSVDNEEK